jgi:hypothetical protein
VFVILALLFLVVLSIEALGFDIQSSARTATLIIGLTLLPFVVSLYFLPNQSDFYSQQLRQPWIPTEDISLASGQSIVGYVLSKSDDWFVVLQEDNRNISYLPSGQVTNQTVCQLGTISTERPLIDLYSAPTVEPSCP